MKIEHSTIRLQAEHHLSKQHSVSESLRVWTSTPEPRAPIAPRSDHVTLSQVAQQKRTQDTVPTDEQLALADDPKVRLLMLLLEEMTGQKVRFFRPQVLQAPDTTVTLPETVPAPNGAGYGLDYQRISQYSESEATSFQAKGLIKTSDGQEIAFNLNLIMQRQYQTTHTTRLQLGDAARVVDPLVIQFAGTAAQLSDQRFEFDLNTDGATELINAPQHGSGFLVLDRNGDGKINAGNELFGPNSGDGFKELARFDSNQDAWLDEQDPIFAELQVWSDPQLGAGTLRRLSATGIGAVYLNAANTPFEIKDQDNRLLGQVRSTSIALTETGQVQSVQQIDLTV